MLNALSVSLIFVSHLIYVACYAQLMDRTVQSQL